MPKSKIVGYKAFDKDLKCRGFQYKVGKTYAHKEDVKICKSGFHYCLNAADVFDYYAFAPETRVCEIQDLGTPQTEGNKSVTGKIKILREISKDELQRLVNTGEGNTGLRNSGDRNSGDGNSGYCNSGYGNSGLFNTDAPPVRLFNKQSKLKWDDPAIQNVRCNIPTFTEWVYFSQMTVEEKAANPKAETTDGYLKTIPYKEAWVNFWANASETVRGYYTTLPHFDAKVFHEITGIDINKKGGAK